MRYFSDPFKPKHLYDLCSLKTLKEAFFFFSLEMEVFLSLKKPPTILSFDPDK